MKLSIRNLGRIESADIEIAPLTVFIGPTNTNKTWAAYSLYGLLRALSSRSFMTPPWGAHYYDLVTIDATLAKNINSATQRVLSFITNSPKTEFVSLEVTRKEIMDQVPSAILCSITSRGLSTVLAIPELHLADTNVTIELAEKDLDNDIVRATITLQQLADRYTIESSFDRKSKEAFRIGQQVARTGSDDILRQSVETTVKQLFLSSARVIPFPAERKALANLSLPFDFPYRQPNMATISRPVSDYNWFLWAASDIKEAQKTGAVSPLIIGGMPEASSLLEDEILAGKVDFKGDRSSKGMEYTLNRGSSLRIHAASSLVKSLAGLDVYLGTFAKPGDMLVIDEPEMNAHPDAQLRIMELLGFLVNKGLRILITTHSPYLVDHLKNLMEAATAATEIKNNLAPMFKLRTKDAFVSADNVAVYSFDREGNVTSVLNRAERSIDWSTFSDASEVATNLYAEILEAKRED